MNPPSMSAEMPLPRADQFLQAVSWLSDRLGTSTAPVVDLAYLRSLPVGTFGRAWADHLDEAGLALLNYGPRRQQLHDGIHVLTGYGTDPLGEAEVQAFLLGAKFRLIHGALMLGLLRGVRQQWQWGQLPLTAYQVRQRLRQAHQRGAQSQFDPDRWQPEALWSQPLPRVQQRFGLRSMDKPA
jgi:ubiquinone biosynthesis protein COQ4